MPPGRHIEELRDITMAEVGAPRMLTAAAQLEGPVADLEFAADIAETGEATGAEAGASGATARAQAAKTVLMSAPGPTIASR